MSDIRQLREQIDACRPGKGDLVLPGLADLAQAAAQDRAVAEELARSQQFDKAVAAAMHDVPIPAGLLDRLLDAAKAADTVERALAQDPPSSPIAISPVQPAPRLTRRRWLIAGGSLALVALIGLTIFSLSPRQPHIVAQAELSQSVDDWLGVVLGTRNATSWNAVNKSPVPPNYAVPTYVLGMPNRWTGFRASGNGWSGRGVAIDLARPTAPRAILFVIASPAHFQVAASPVTWLTLTGKTKAVAWQNLSSNLLYILVVDEDRGQRLEQYLKRLPQA
jgi:hypothetical protein